VNLVFVQPSIQGASCISIELNEFGEIMNWPEGFFDESEEAHWVKTTLDRRFAASH
jgi:hypothetical protein